MFHYLINKRQVRLGWNGEVGGQTVQLKYRKFDLNEFVANVLRDNMGMIIFDLRGCGGC